jgi:hypothetical protein
MPLGSEASRRGKLPASVFVPEFPFRLENPDFVRGLPPGLARLGLGGGPEHHDRVSMGGGQDPPSSRPRQGSRPSQGRPGCCGKEPSRSGHEGANSDDPHRHDERWRCCGNWIRGKYRPARREYHRVVHDWGASSSANSSSSLRRSFPTCPAWLSSGIRPTPAMRRNCDTPRMRLKR